jgi:hypothetical protein
MNNLGNWASFLGTGIGAIDSLATKGGTDFGAFASGAGMGASMGAAFGGVGVGVGALLGGTASLLQRQDEKRRAAELKRQQEEAKRKAEFNVRKGRQYDLNNRFNVDGMNVPGFYAKGGNTSSSYLAEGGETIQHNPSDTPKTFNGNLQQLSSDISEIRGPSHESQSGGVLMQGGERIFSDQIKLSKEAIKYFKSRL